MGCFEEVSVSVVAEVSVAEVSVAEVGVAEVGVAEASVAVWVSRSALGTV